MHFMPNSSYEFRVGFSQVIKGWTLGVLGMCVGDSRKLTIPPHLAYGSKGAQPTVPRKILINKKSNNLRECNGIYSKMTADEHNHQGVSFIDIPNA